MRTRFVLRRALANLSRYPEGYIFAWRGHNGPLLTPPNLIAVQRQDGTWYRRVRNITQDGPMPYTMQWYQQYLRAHDLPVWFLSLEHIAIIDGDAEAESLGLTNSLSPLPTPAPQRVAEFMQRSAHYILPGLRGPDLPFPIDLDATQRARLRFRFPATAANASIDPDNRVYVLPSGHITIRLRHRQGSAGALEGTDVRDEPVEADQVQWREETGSSHLASYRIEGRRVGLPAGVNRDRTQEATTARAHGGWVDLDEQPRGLGSLCWLDERVDSQIARDAGFASPQEVLWARERGDLDDVPTNNRPMTVWFPDPRYLDPVTHPRGEGRWEYLTTYAERQAHMNLGNQEAFPDDPTPTADLVWNRRDIARRTRRADDTQGIQMVWVPAARSPSPVLDNPDRPSSKSPTPDPSDTRVDSQTSLTHRPENDGVHDQTGVEGERVWQTVRIKGNIRTMDRSPAHANEPQEWKTWSVDQGGKWVQWHRYRELLRDWNEDLVMSLNKWREQTQRRAGFYAKRRDNRPSYTSEQRTWVFGYVKAAGGNRPDMSISDIAREFNRRFSQSRNDGGIQALVDNLRSEYEKFGGNQKPTSGRGRRKSKKRPATEPEPESRDDEEGNVEKDNDQRDGKDEGERDDGADE